MAEPPINLKIYELNIEKGFMTADDDGQHPQANLQMPLYMHARIKVRTPHFNPSRLNILNILLAVRGWRLEMGKTLYILI